MSKGFSCVFEVIEVNTAQAEERKIKVHNHQYKAMSPSIIAKLAEQKLGNYGQMVKEIWLTKKNDVLLQAVMALPCPLHLLEIKESSNEICVKTNLKEQNLIMQPTWSY